MFRSPFRCMQVPGIPCFVKDAPEYPAHPPDATPEEHRSPGGPGSSSPPDTLVHFKENEDQTAEVQHLVSITRGVYLSDKYRYLVSPEAYQGFRDICTDSTGFLGNFWSTICRLNQIFHRT